MTTSYLKNQRGFTLAETVTAMAIFAFVLLIIAYGVTSLFRIYGASGQIRSTQKHARLVSQSLGSDIDTAVGYSSVAASSAHGYPQDMICLFRSMNSGLAPTGNGAVYFTTSSGTTYTLHKMTFKGMPTNTCVNAPNAAYPTLTFEGQDQTLTDSKVSLMVFDVAPSSDASFVNVNLSIVPVAAIGDLVDLSAHPLPKCFENRAGSEYCAITNLTIGGATHKELEN